MLWLVILAVVFAFYGYAERQRLRTQRALTAITEKGVDAELADMDNIVIIFKNGNVSDDDLTDFIPAFDERSRIPGFGRITSCGSTVPVSVMRHWTVL